MPHEPPWWQRLPHLAGRAGAGMRLVLAVVQQEDAEHVAGSLVGQGYPVTRLRTAGGFLRQGNETLLMGISAGALPGVLETIREHCRTRQELLVPEAPDEFTAPWTAAPVNVTVGGATVLITAVERYCRLTGHADTDAAPSTAAAAATPGGERGSMDEGTKLIIAIVQADDADRAIRALLEQQVRVTRINTVGGFLKRGNVTLLVGVDAALVDSVIETLSRVVGSRTANGQSAPPPADKSARATVFVVGTQRFLQI
jgi:uncharacterized protein YaaQ